MWWLLLGLLGCGDGGDGFSRGFGEGDDDDATEESSVPSTGLWDRISTGGTSACGLRPEGHLQCWGSDDEDITLGIPTGEIEALSVGGHGCVLRPDGELTCWIDGIGLPAPAGPFSDLAVGILPTCARGAGRLWTCWAGFAEGDPVDAVPAEPFDQVAAGFSHACGLGADGTVSCWGEGDFGQLTPPAGAFVQIDAERDLTCARRADGTSACWGSWYGSDDHPEGPYTDVAAGLDMACGVTPAGTLDCWGALLDWGMSRPIPAGEGWVDVDCGTSHCCAQHEEGWIDCFGDEEGGELDVPRP